MSLFRAIKNGMTPALRALFIVLTFLIGAILLSSLLQSCSAPQVCRYCWVSKGN